MNFKLLKFVFILLLFSCAGCQKDNENISKLIIGKWDWIKSVSPWTGVVSNPQTAGYSYVLEFTTSGEINEYKNDTLTVTSTYIIEVNSTDTENGMLIINSDTRSQIFIDNDSLLINAAFVDGPVSYYARLK